HQHQHTFPTRRSSDLNQNVEIMHVKICNKAETEQKITPIAAIPIYGRSADNIRDHRNVTSMLHRIYTKESGVLVKPTMSFDEKGDRKSTRLNSSHVSI